LSHVISQVNINGINLLTLLWTDGERYIPVDFRIYNKSVDGLTKNDHFRTMPRTAAERGFTPEVVLFDSWYSGLENLKRNRPVKKADISESGEIVHLKGYGLIKVFKIVRTDDDIRYQATYDLTMNDLMRLKYFEISWMIETYHRGIKQFRGAERCQARSERTRRNHIESALRTFLRIEYHCFVKGLSWFEAKTSIIRDAVRTYLTHPIYTLDSINLYAVQMDSLIIPAG